MRLEEKFWGEENGVLNGNLRLAVTGRCWLPNSISCGCNRVLSLEPAGPPTRERIPRFLHQPPPLRPRRVYPPSSALPASPLAALLLRLWLRQCLIRLGNLLELLRGPGFAGLARVLVRVPLDGELLVGTLDLFCARAVPHPEDSVVVFLRWWGWALLPLPPLVLLLLLALLLLPPLLLLALLLLLLLLLLLRLPPLLLYT